MRFECIKVYSKMVKTILLKKKTTSPSLNTYPMNFGALECQKIASSIKVSLTCVVIFKHVDTNLKQKEIDIIVLIRHKQLNILAIIK